MISDGASPEFPEGGEIFMKFMENKKLAARIGIITTIITLAGMTVLWLFASTNAASVVKSDITNQMTDAVESARAGSAGRASPWWRTRCAA